MWLNYFTAIIFVVFMVPISINMISIIKINYQNGNNITDRTKKVLRNKIKKVILLSLLLVLIMFLTFFMNYFLAANQ